MKSTANKIFLPEICIPLLIALLLSVAGVSATPGEGSDANSVGICVKCTPELIAPLLADEELVFMAEAEALMAMRNALGKIKDPWLKALKKQELLKAYDDSVEGRDHDQNTI